MSSSSSYSLINVSDPIPTQQIFVRHFTDTSITVLWAPVFNRDVYILTIDAEDADENQEVFTDNDQQLEYTFTGLKQGTQYTIQVIASGGGSTSQITFQTTQWTSMYYLIIHYIDTWLLSSFFDPNLYNIGQYIHTKTHTPSHVYVDFGLKVTIWS